MSLKKKPEKRLIGYARVSTQNQDLARQTKALKRLGCAVIYSDKASGKSMAGRPELARALDDLDTGDELVIAEWDRATRSMWDGLQIIKAVIDAGASIKVLDRSYIDLATPMGRGFMAMMSAMAEDERLRIIKRTHEGRKIAQAKGVQHGAQAEAHAAPEGRSTGAHRQGRDDARPRQELRCQRQHDFEVERMNGQWLGSYSGTNNGILFINLDDMGSHYAGNLFAYDDNTSLPFAYSYIRTPDKQTSGHLCLDLVPLHPHTGDASPWAQISSLFAPNVTFPRRAEADFDLDNGTLKVRWKTDIGTFGSADIAATRAGEPSECEPLMEIDGWAAFKSYVNGLDHRRFIFRGQRNPLRLRTGFHRTGRADLLRFLAQDIPTLHRHLSQRTTYIFNLAIAEQNGAFFNLVQHHGYPTPLLDWTYSPYVGAFFAYQRVKNSEARKATAHDKVRIFMFDQMLWRNTLKQIPKVTWCQPHFSI